MMNDGGFIAPGCDAELDDLRKIATEGHQWLAEFQAREQQRTGIAKLKVKHVSTFGFVIEIPKGSVALAPADYERRQTLTTGERYVTPELKEYERKVMGAQEKAIAIEQRLFKDILMTIAAKTVEIQETSLALGELDATLSLADRALAAGYVRPTVDDSDVLEIVDGRHPIVEQLPDAEPFVPNSAFLNTTTDQIMLITGPNMAGKSTYIRQVATIAVMSRSTRPEAVISSCALRRVGSETRLTNVSGRPASRSPSCMAATMAAAERYASLPPRSTQTLPLFMASTAASEVTFGRLS